MRSSSLPPEWPGIEEQGQEMNGWMIAVDGSAVNLAHVTHVLAEKRASHVDDTWFVMARPAGVALATGLESREAAVAWIETHFRSAS